MSSDVQRKYCYPVTDDYTAKIHTVAGVKRLREDSNLMRLLQELEEDGHDVGGAVIELLALLNYVSCTAVDFGELETYLSFCIKKVQENR